MSRVLVVEDEEHLAQGLRFNLEAEGHSVQLAACGEDALQFMLANREVFDAVVTGASPKGTWVRLRHPVVEGKLELHGRRAVQVGDRLRVRLTRVDPPRGFIDFALESNADS